MDIKTLASSSRGNCYYISDGYTSLFLEAGIPFKNIIKKLDFNVSDISGCLITHEHLDHSKYIKDFIKMGIDCYMSEGTNEVLDIKSYRIKTIKSKQSFRIGTFHILPFDVQHDALEPLGFLISSIETDERLLFVMDTYFIKYRFEELTHILIECNYSEKTLNPECPYKQRLKLSHFSLENVVEFLRANDLSQVQEIHLLHLSNDNSDENYFKEMIQRETGKIVKIGK